MRKMFRAEHKRRGFAGAVFLWLFKASQTIILSAFVAAILIGITASMINDVEASSELSPAHQLDAGPALALLAIAWAAATVVFGGLAYATRERTIIDRHPSYRFPVISEAHERTIQDLESKAARRE